jgi:hypothetical protein
MELINSFLLLLPDILAALGALAVFGTAVARLTPSKKDDEYAGKFKRFVDKLIAWCPTLGPNPKAK